MRRNKRVQYSFRGLIRAVVVAVFISVVVAAALPVLADGFGNADVLLNRGYLEDTAGVDLDCTESDVSIAKITYVTVLDDGCAFPGDTGDCMNHPVDRAGDSARFPGGATRGKPHGAPDRLMHSFHDGGDCTGGLRSQ